jgi:hypothetical protein
MEWVSNASPQPLDPQGEPVPFDRLGVPQGRSGRVREVSLPPGFHHRTLQPVTSCSIDGAIAGPFILATVSNQPHNAQFCQLRYNYSLDISKRFDARL